MTDYDFIIREPWLLDEYKMPALEKELIIRMTNSRSGGVFPLRAAHDLMIETLNFYYEENVPFTIEVYAIQARYCFDFVSLLVQELGVAKEKHTTITFKNEGTGLFLLTFEEVWDEDDKLSTNVEYVEDFTSLAPVAMVIQVVGYKNIDDKHECLGVLYDRKHTKHGFVRFTDADCPDVSELQVELLLQCVNAVGTRYNVVEEVETSEPDEEP